MNINGLAHHFVENDWKLVQVDMPISEHQLLPTFAANADYSFDYSIHRNPGLIQDSLDHVSVVADIIARIHEVHTSGTSSSAHVSEITAENQLNHLSRWMLSESAEGLSWFKWWNAVKWTGIAVLTILLLLPFCWIIRRCHDCYLGSRKYLDQRPFFDPEVPIQEDHAR